MSDEPCYNILVVDDDKSSIDVLTRILKPAYAVRVAKTGAMALRRAKEEPPDLILLDIVMSDMSGFGVLSELKQSPETRDVPVICITGLNDAKDEEKAFSLGAADYITKPFNNAVVRARVKNQMDLVRHIRTIERMGLVDALTDLPNLRCFDNRISLEWNRAMREGTPISLLMMDIDRFKRYNDTYGHPQGDVALQTVAQIFKCALRRKTDLAARVGGEEFAILLPNTDLSGGLLIAEAVRKNTENCDIPVAGEDATTRITLSVGVVCATPTAESSLQDFVLRADKALYAAKAAGRNRVISG